MTIADRLERCPRITWVQKDEPPWTNGLTRFAAFQEDWDAIVAVVRAAGRLNAVNRHLQNPSVEECDLINAEDALAERLAE